jgi:hypothetical protein
VNDVAQRYVKLVLAMGEHDADYVDAYYGPPEWREEAKGRTLLAIRNEAAALLDVIPSVSEGPGGPGGAPPSHTGPSLTLGMTARQTYLRRQLEALLARIDILEGKRLSFDEESKALYDAVAPHHSAEHFQALLHDLDTALPGRGAVGQRYESYRREFVIARAKLDAVFQKAIDGCRARTLAHMALPEGESFTVEYVNNRSWSGYNWFQGGYRSLIQVNTDLPIFIDRAIDLACHEGYPGHHVYNTLLEKNLVRDRGWVEFSVYALFSPQSLIAEGSANYGIDVAFPASERVEYEARELFPPAGLDPSRAEQYYAIFELAAKLAYAGNEAARRYLDGVVTASEAVDWLATYALMSPERARQRVRFFDQYRSYVINYNLGKDLVRDYVERQGGDRWAVFADLLSSPRLPSALMSS